MLYSILTTMFSAARKYLTVLSVDENAVDIFLVSAFRLTYTWTSEPSLTTNFCIIKIIHILTLNKCETTCVFWHQKKKPHKHTLQTTLQWQSGNCMFALLLFMEGLSSVSWSEEETENEQIKKNEVEVCDYSPWQSYPGTGPCVRPARPPTNLHRPAVCSRWCRPPSGSTHRPAEPHSQTPPRPPLGRETSRTRKQER